MFWPNAPKCVESEATAVEPAAHVADVVLAVPVLGAAGDRPDPGVRAVRVDLVAGVST
jgi:hypothetical protein